MRKHTKIFLKAFNFSEYDWEYIPCIWCKGPAVDINHIEPRGMGGSDSKDCIENLTPMCRTCHRMYESKKIDKNELKRRHLEWIREKGLDIKQKI